MEQQATWLDFLGEFDFEIMYRPGARHRNADALSPRRCRTSTFCQRGIDEEEVETRVTVVLETRVPSFQFLRFGTLSNWRLHKPKIRSWPWSMVGVQSRNLPWCDVIDQGQVTKEYCAQWDLLELSGGSVSQVVGRG